MKKLLYLAALIILASSCKASHYGIGKVKKADPYVKLRSGEIIEADKGSKVKKAGIFQNKIRINDTAVKARDVAFYSDGKNTFANVKTGNIFGKKSFAKKITEGKINIYRSTMLVTTTSTGMGGGMGGMGGGMGGMGGGMGMHTSSHHENVDYIQLASSDEVKRLTYKNLKPMIPASSSASDELGKYKKNRMIANIVGFGGIALMASGVVLATSSGGGSDAAFPLFIGGFASCIATIPIKGHGRRHLYKSIETFNKSKK